MKTLKPSINTAINPAKIFLLAGLCLHFIACGASNKTFPPVSPDSTISTYPNQSSPYSKAMQPRSIEELQQTDWWTTVQKNMQEQEYHITHQKRYHRAEMKDAYQASNRTQNLRTYFSSEGIQVVRRTEKSPTWSADIKLEGFYKGNELIPFAKEIDPVVTGNRIEFDRDSIIEWYENKPQGIEQGFTINKKPKGSNGLILELGVAGNITPVLSENGEAIHFLTESNTSVLKYSKLHVYDSQGQTLPSRFTLANNAIEIWVDDHKALYPITIDPILTSPSWAIDSNQKYAHYGTSVHTAGDVNGDGYSDVIVGAPYFDNGTTDSQHLSLENGKVFVYYGSSVGLSTSPSWTAMCDQTQARFGYSVGTAGDVNNDGYSDIIIGAPDYTNSQTEEGAVFVYFGSASGFGADATQADADWMAESNQANSGFGHSVGTAGDVNGDSYSDVIIGAPYFDDPEIDEGKVFIYHGSATGLGPSGTPDNADWSKDAWTYAGSLFGFSVSTAGDVDGDGYSDVVVGVPDYDLGQENEGLAFVFYGTSGGIVTGGYTYFESNCINANLGYSVGTAGDVDNDGYSDIILGIPNHYCSGYEGKVLVYYGASSGAGGGGSWSLYAGSGGVNEMYVGSSVGSAGDVNGDGFADVIIGGHGYPSPNTYDHKASVFVYFGSLSGLNPSANISNADWSAEYSYPGDYRYFQPVM
jgi:hypothetical protein